MDKEKKSNKPPTFEEALGQVERIVESLEQGDLGLEESLAAYEQGVKRLKRCQEILAKAERRIAVLSGKDAQGNPVTRPLEPDESEKKDEDVPGDAPTESESSLF